jgi:hypothetical protein
MVVLIYPASDRTCTVWKGPKQECDDYVVEFENARPWPKRQTMKASDITDRAIYELVASAKVWRSNEPGCLMLWDALKALPQFPPKVIKAKLRQMVAKKRLNGCACGCRGDFCFPWETFGGPHDRTNWEQRIEEYLRTKGITA